MLTQTKENTIKGILEKLKYEEELFSSIGELQNMMKTFSNSTINLTLKTSSGSSKTVSFRNSYFRKNFEDFIKNEKKLCLETVSKLSRDIVNLEES